jgi:hypothetical protein
MRSSIRHPWKTGLFALLSLADLMLTWWLLVHSGGGAYEANPIARLCLEHHGWLGLACFKAAVVVLVLVLIAVISRFRPRAAALVLRFGCATMVLVVGYSASLCRATAFASPDEADTVAIRDCEEINRQSADERRQWHEYHLLVDKITKDLSKGHCSVRTAAEQLASAKHPKRHLKLQALAYEFPKLSLRARFGAHACRRAIVQLRTDRKAARRLARRLEREFALTYGTSPPCSFERWAPGGDTAQSVEETDNASQEASVEGPL